MCVLTWDYLKSRCSQFSNVLHLPARFGLAFELHSFPYFTLLSPFTFPSLLSTDSLHHHCTYTKHIYTIWYQHNNDRTTIMIPNTAFWLQCIWLLAVAAAKMEARQRYYFLRLVDLFGNGKNSTYVFNFLYLLNKCVEVRPCLILCFCTGRCEHSNVLWYQRTQDKLNLFTHASWFDVDKEESVTVFKLSSGVVHPHLNLLLGLFADLQLQECRFYREWTKM